MERPADLGRRLARRYTEPGPRPSPRELAERLGVAVVEVESPPPAQPGLRAEYHPDPPQISLYRAPLARLSAALRADPQFAPLPCTLEEVHLAHELFHHLEVTEGLGLRRGEEESEAAAHAFARELCGLSFDPRELSGLA